MEITEDSRPFDAVRSSAGGRTVWAVVTAVPGGAADQAGNRYERLWMVLRVLDLLDGEVRRVRWEPPGAVGVGAEWVLDRGGAVWVEQVKDRAHRWTIRHRYIDVDNTAVLAIEVDPPRPGDSMHTLKKSYESFDRGAIFVRKSGKTHPAEPEDTENLQQRLQGAQLDLDLTLIGDLPISWFDKPALIATITQIADSKQEAQLHRARRTHAPDAFADAYPRIGRTMEELSMGLTTARSSNTPRRWRNGIPSG